MFYYKITTRTKQGEHARTSRNTFHEFTRPAHVGEHIGVQLTKPSVTSISVTRISQGAYLRARG